MHVSTVGLWIEGGIFVSAVVGIMVASNRHNEKKRLRIYERIDEVKDDSDDTYMKKEVCGERIKQLDKIEEKVECIPEMKANLDLLVSRQTL